MLDECLIAAKSTKTIKNTQLKGHHNRLREGQLKADPPTVPDYQGLREQQAVPVPATASAISLGHAKTCSCLCGSATLWGWHTSLKDCFEASLVP